MTSLPLLLLVDERPRPLVPYEFSWSLHPSVLLGTGLLGALYFWGIGPLRRRYGLGPPAEGWRVACFCAGLLLIDPEARLRALIRPPLVASAIAADIRNLARN